VRLRWVAVWLLAVASLMAFAAWLGMSTQPLLAPGPVRALLTRIGV
jgi:hypothetical protein